MAFNSLTYQVNQAKADAGRYLASAREIKKRAAIGRAYDWELPQIAHFVRCARASMHSHLALRAAREQRRAARSN